MVTHTRNFDGFHYMGLYVRGYFCTGKRAGLFDQVPVELVDTTLTPVGNVIEIRHIFGTGE